MESISLLRHQIFSVSGLSQMSNTSPDWGPQVLAVWMSCGIHAGLAPNTWATLDKRPQPSLRASIAAGAICWAMPRRNNGCKTASCLALRPGAHEDLAAQLARTCPWDELRQRQPNSTGRVASSDVDTPAPPPDLEGFALLHCSSMVLPWVDGPLRDHRPAHRLIGMGWPTDEERAGGAGRVELYRGPTGHVTRFPRYNDPSVCARGGRWR